MKCPNCGHDAKRHSRSGNRLDFRACPESGCVCDLDIIEIYEALLEEAERVIEPVSDLILIQDRDSSYGEVNEDVILLARDLKKKLRGEK